MNTISLISTPLGPRLVAGSGTFAGTRGSRLLELARWRHEDALAAAVVPVEAAVTLRLATLLDSPAVERVAALDEAAVPGGPLLVAEVDGRIRAVLGLAGGRLVADPFFPSASLAPLLRARAAQLSAQPAAPVPTAAAANGHGGLTPACC